MFIQADGILHPSFCFISQVFISREGITISKELRINEEIRCKEVRLIDDAGEQLGVMPPREAAKIAAEKGLDLVEIAPTANPPVCRIMDYGKYRYEQSKREKEAKKNQHTVDIKEIKLSLNIDTHDFNTKLNNALKFIRHGDKVKVSIRFRGREMGHPEIGLDTMKRFADALAFFGDARADAVKAEHEDYRQRFLPLFWEEHLFR